MGKTWRYVLAVGFVWGFIALHLVIKGMGGNSLFDNTAQNPIFDSYDETEEILIETMDTVGKM